MRIIAFKIPVEKEFVSLVLSKVPWTLPEMSVFYSGFKIKYSVLHSSAVLVDTQCVP